MDFLSHLNAVRVLIAESNPDEMDYTAAILEEAGYNVFKAYYAGDALFALNNNSFDLALVDARMIDSEQRPLSAQMYRYSPVRWIGLIDQRYTEPDRLIRQGAAAYARRPFSSNTLLHQIEDVINGARPSPPAPTSASPDENIRAVLEQRLVEQQTLSALARMLSAVLDLDTLLTQVVDAAVRLSNAEEGLLLLPDEDGQTLFIRAVKGIDTETARNFRIKTQDTLAGNVFQNGQPVLVGDQGWQKIKTEYLVKSLLYVPLSLKGQTIGVLGVNNKHADRTFTKHDTELLQDLAAHAAIAIENARLYEESVLRARELSFLAQAGEAANSTLEIDEVLSIIAGQLISTLDVGQCYIGEWHADQQELRTLAVCHRALWQPNDGYTFALNELPAVEQAFSHQQMIVTAPSSRPDEDPLCNWLPHHCRAEQVGLPPAGDAGAAVGVGDALLSAAFHNRLIFRRRGFSFNRLALDIVVTLSGSDARAAAENAVPQRPTVARYGACPVV